MCQMCPSISVVEAECQSGFGKCLRQNSGDDSRPSRAAHKYPGEQAMGLAVAGCNRDCPSAQRLGGNNAGGCNVANTGKRADNAFPGVKALWWLTLAAK